MNNAQKTPIARALELFAGRKAASEIDMQGQALPASVVAVKSSGIVTVKFELQNVPWVFQQMDVPIAGSEYIRLPIQKGMLGWVMPADKYLGGVSGLGGGTADWTDRPNLSNLVFSPIGNKNWTATDDPNKLVLYGPDGTIIRDENKKNTLDVNSSNITFTLTAGGLVVNLRDGQPMTVNGNMVVSGGIALGGNITAVDGVSVYAGNIRTSGAVTAGFGTGDQVDLQTLIVSDVEPGIGQSGPPVPGS